MSVRKSLGKTHQEHLKINSTADLVVKLKPIYREFMWFFYEHYFTSLHSLDELILHTHTPWILVLIIQQLKMASQHAGV